MTRPVAVAFAAASILLVAGAGAVEPPRLPEDPVAGKRAEQQWRAHMQKEEEERQLRYDRRRLKQHRAVIKLLTAARTRYDRARSRSAVDRARARMPALSEDVRRRIHVIDEWGNNSRLLADYQALLAALADSYPAARVAALDGDARALADARADMDRRLKKMAAWLTEAAETEDE